MQADDGNDASPPISPTAESGSQRCGARGKRSRRAPPAAAARHSQSARAYTDRSSCPKPLYGQFILSKFFFLVFSRVGSTWFARELGNTIDTQLHGQNIGSKNMEKKLKKKTTKKT